MIAFGGRRGPHRSGSRCRGRPIEPSNVARLGARGASGRNAGCRFPGPDARRLGPEHDAQSGRLAPGSKRKESRGSHYCSLA